MRFVSLFAGVGGFDLGLEQAGHECVGQVEIDKNCLGVLQHQWPDVPKHNDVITAKEWANEQGLVGSVDVVCGGFPCQDLSVAGKRAGLDGARSGLFFDALSFATHVKAKTIILENVPGLLSSNQGRDFGIVLTSLADAGFSNIQWSVLDSQFFGVPQRRRRVFIVASVGEQGFNQVFFEREGSNGDHPQGNAQGQGATSAIDGSVVARMRGFGDYTVDGTASALKARDYKDATDLVLPFVKSRRAQNTEDHETWVESAVTPTLNVMDNGNESRATVLMIDGTRVGDVRVYDDEISQTVISRWGTGGGNVPYVFPIQGTIIGRSDTAGPQGKGFDEDGDPMYTIDTISGHGVAVTNAIGFSHTQGLDPQASDTVFPTLRANGSGQAVSTSSVVRRLTPRECERLQGFPDDWTAQRWDEKKQAVVAQADSSRYKQMGNAVTVNVIAWIGGKLK